MDGEYVDTHDSEPIRFDEYHYSLPAPKMEAESELLTASSSDGGLVVTRGDLGD
ncbi:uncharacterized protein PHALS_03733 [Plasmopara halstedii]|uniref:Uncharacterized protein n=1 Tax=Plasmopara halstedii TaxID=4781 RepID=A0A0P1AZ04_PLAHL|nr:uncharacterized protein PHALS_03733 [Plasmopara halstedii]CEG47072.1 hypothetical protein PHALS_03733 [Plasmopara halstedii]|eukprot:XP_024583441.1 hypothetical protein PHALS_03733 [Plasmopara halstedii]